MPGLFNKKILDERIRNYEINNLDDKINKIKEWQKNLGRIKGLNEKRLQGAFLRAIFEDILGYENTPQKDNWTLDIEATTDIDAKHPDGIIGFFERADNEEIRGHEAVIELKGPQISLDKDQKRQGTTYKSPVDQAFSYTNKLDKCKWVIVSNFMEIRLYKVGRSKEYFEVFLLDDLDKIETFKKFYYLLNKDNLLSETGESITLELSEKTLKKEEDISVKFYNLYKNVRINLFEHLKEKNTDKDPELLLEKAQKFLDRIIFIGFCEDKGLLPNDLLHEAIQRGKDSFSPSDTAVWDQIRGVFRSIDKGNAAHNINAYNGGLFEYDEDLDGLVIANDFFEAIYKISDYDFDSDVDVNILGHIFEQSISDLEKLKSDIKDDEFDKNESKRKKDGIFYTPQYITSYIVENAIGSYLEDLKEELGYYELPDIEDAGSKNWKTIYTNQHLNFYNKYEEKLKNIKVLDPACGSGAFLNQAFDYLLKEHQWLNKQRDLLKGGQSSIFALDAIQRNILRNNIFGVDLNEESVEITKLSLWLKTANKNKPLTNLDDNIKCGNSLIDDPEVAGDKAFKWQDKFGNIMDAGGFDVVVGNPPYGAGLSKIEKTYFKSNYKVSEYQLDSYVLFFEKSIDIIKTNGYLGFITPNTFLLMKYYKKLRYFLLKNTLFSKVVSFKYPVFEDAVVDTIIIILKKNKFKNKGESKSKFPVSIINKKEEFEKINVNHYTNQKYFWKASKYKFNIFINSRTQKLLNDLSKHKKVKSVCEVRVGVMPYETGKGNPPQTKADIKDKIYHSSFKKDEDYKKYLMGKDINRFIISPIKEKWIKYGDNLAAKRSIDLFEGEPKIVIRQTADELICALDEEEYITMKNVHNVKIKNDDLYLLFLLGILNSKLLNFYLQKTIQEKGKTFAEVKATHVKNLPIVLPIKEKQKSFIKYVEKLINIKKTYFNKNNITFIDILKKFSSSSGVSLKRILNESNFKNEIYSGRASKIRNFTVNINTNIITIYLKKSSSGKYEVLKFEEDDKYKRQYIKYYLENLTDEQLEEIDNKYSGNILKKTLQIEIPDYNKKHVVKKVVKEWESLQQEIINLKNEIEKIDNKIDQMVYNLYDLSEGEIQIVEEEV